MLEIPEPDGQAVASHLSLSEERDLQLRLRLEAWRDGWHACEIVHGVAYERGFADGVLAYKRAQHDVYRLVGLEMARWGGWREDFGRSRPGDFPGQGAA